MKSVIFDVFRVGPYSGACHCRRIATAMACVTILEFVTVSCLHTLPPWAKCYNTALSVILKYLKQARVIVHFKLFKPGLIFVGKTRSLPLSGALERCFSRVSGQTLKPITNIHNLWTKTMYNIKPQAQMLQKNVL